MNTSRRNQVFAQALVLAGLAGCGSPMLSHRVSEDDRSKPSEGVHYYLTKSKVSIPVSLKLKTCSPEIVVEVKISDPVVSPVADEKYEFRVTPRDAWGVFRAIDNASLTLTKDRRLAKAETKTTDKTFETLVAVAKALASGGGTTTAALVKGAPSPTPEPTPAPLSCIKRVSDALSEEKSLEATKVSLQKKEVEYLSAFSILADSGDAPKALRAFSAAIKRTAEQLTSLKKELSVDEEINLSSKDDATFIGTGELDISKWFDGAKDVKFSVNSIMVKPKTLTAISASEIDGLHQRAATNSGVLYRQGGSGEVTTTIAALGNSKQLKFADMNGASKSDNVSPFLQWGRWSYLPLDVGFLSSNAVAVTFDEWGVPASATWSAQPVGILEILNLYHAAVPVPKALPSQTDLDRAAILKRLLENCKNAPLETLPGYCTSILQ
jgi:hypothetical protein